MGTAVDVLIICALRSELEALLEVRAGVVEGWSDVAADPPYHVATFEGERGRFRVAAARPTEMAGAAASQIAAQLAERLRPGCIAMCGVCAGHPDDTDLGDVIIADRVFHHDHGKRTNDGFEGDLRTYMPDDRWVRAAQDLEGPAAQLRGYALPDDDAAKWWLLERLLAKRAPKKSGFGRYFPGARQGEMLEALLEQELLDLEGERIILADKGRRAAERRRVIHGAAATELPYHVHAGPIASGNYVAADPTIWAEITGRGMRKILGVEMEAAAIGTVAHRHRLPFVVAKGVMDHADSHKNDRFKAFAARASAELLCAFLRRVVEPRAERETMSAARIPPALPTARPQHLRSTPPRVFISYSHDSDAHRDRVLELAQRLRRDGIDAWLDRFDPAPPQGWPRWMIDEVARAEFVVLVCTEAYRRRFEGREQPSRGQGVTFEGLLANQLLYEQRLDLEHVVPVTFAAAGNDVIPLAVRASTSHDLWGNYEGLRRRLTGQLAVEPVVLGDGAAVSKGLPAEVSLTDRLAMLMDELEERVVVGKDDRDVREEILAVRRQIRSGPTLETGDILAARYRLVEIIGSGGFAMVWKAYDRNTRHTVAIKVLHGQWSNDATRIERFRAGARRLLDIRHEAVVKIHGEVEDDDRYHFCVMDWMAGGDLRRAILEGRLERSPGLEAVARVARALAHAHALGIVHRDVKPANVLLDELGHGYITDFDLARAKDSTHGTRTGGMGTFVYAAPEQHQDAANVDARADVYGVGMCVLFVLAGKDPPAFVAGLKPNYFDELECSERLRATLKLAVAYEADERTVGCAQLADALLDEVSPKVDVRVVQPERESLPSTIEAPRGGVELVLIPEGEFMMGSPPDEEGHFDDEGPQQEVELSAFWLAKTPVTNAQFARYLEANPKAPKPESWGHHDFNQPQQPVVGVSWDEARAYCEWAGLVLPTEAQWEYACRAGTTTRFWSGDGEQDLARVGWYIGNSGNRLHVVGEKPANSWGLHDMHGNVWEWCLDSWVDDYRTTHPRPGDGLRVKPVGVGFRVSRGGSFGDPARFARSAFRYLRQPGLRYRLRGFRPAQGIP